MIFGTISVGEWLGIAIATAGWLLSWFNSKMRLPGWARRWLGDLGQDAVLEAIKTAERFDTPEERRAEAIKYLQRIAVKRLGLSLPDSIAALLIEYVYQLYKRGRARL